MKKRTNELDIIYLNNVDCNKELDWKPNMQVYINFESKLNFTKPGEVLSLTSNNGKMKLTLEVIENEKK